jgi:hypothetical protein
LSREPPDPAFEDLAELAVARDVPERDAEEAALGAGALAARLSSATCF